MFSSRQKRKQASVWRARVIQGALLLLAFYVAVSAYDRYTVAQEMSERRAVAEAEVAKLEARKAELAEEVSYLSHERGIEAEMRRQFDVAREGEHVVIILDEEREEEPEPVRAPATSSVPTRPWYHFW